MRSEGLSWQWAGAVSVVVKNVKMNEQTENTASELCGPFRLDEGIIPGKGSRQHFSKALRSQMQTELFFGEFKKCWHLLGRQEARRRI